jgi:hypothetical protein
MAAELISQSRPSRVKDLSGLEFRFWTVEGYAGKKEYKSSSCHFWACKCRCGTENVVPTQSLTSGASKSCGCDYKRLSRHPEYCVWALMKSRCTNPKDKGYHRYGGRGISVCDRWILSFEDFLNDMKPRPTPVHSIDREDNDGNYEPDNCRWATSKEQGRNRSDNRILEHDGQELTIAEWSEKTGLSEEVIRYRVSNGWSHEDAITKPVRKARLLAHDGKSMSINEWSIELGLPDGIIKSRLRNGRTISEALSTPVRPISPLRILDYKGKSQTIAEWAKELGIEQEAIKGRLRRKWSVNRALSTMPSWSRKKPQP